MGVQVTAKRKTHPHYQQPRNLNELSIQSYLIELRVAQPDANPVVLFEDGWFTDNASALPLGILISTEAFLLNLEKAGIIRSAADARKAIATLRPDASLIIHQQPLGKAK